MASHWAIVIGISQYSYMDALKYATQDVIALRDYLIEANFHQVYCFCESSADLALNGEVTLSMQPTLANLQRFLELRFATPFLQPEDTLWFFFVGHGWHYGNQDYLMPTDAHPDLAETTALSLPSITESLRQSGTARIVLVLDACHSELQPFGQGFGTDPQGVITLFSAHFGQLSRTLDLLHHGSFTCALLDGFKTLSRQPNATIEQLYWLLKETLPKLNRYGLKPPQTPRLQVDPALSTAMIQLPQARVKKRHGWNQFKLRYPLKFSGGTGGLALIATVGRPTKTWAIAGLTGAAICVSLVSYISFQHPQWLTFLSTSSASQTKTKPTPATPSKPTKTATSAHRVAPTRMVPHQPDQEAGLGEVPSERTPRPGVYYTTNPQFTASRREIGKSGDRLCIKLVNGSPNTPQGQFKVVVSSVSRRADGYYIDATGQKLNLGGFYSEVSDGKLLWQRLETDVDESGLMGECLTAKSGYVRSYQPGG